MNSVYFCFLIILTNVDFKSVIAGRIQSNQQGDQQATTQDQQRSERIFFYAEHLHNRTIQNSSQIPLISSASKAVVSQNEQNVVTRGKNPVQSIISSLLI